ncbi:hypothetical protein [Stakelama tenebrarum]|uniref:Uncharacterized protein n=1 Tax=Stakelama tenebrarum TaxID=2711215 RepID=A0A6G6Y3C9_9SPHN|nr:hypothetical protein [Sphingosinithalassobacter tenebrarum]QIG79351.1 hypothetical protein G5C33_05815 [Sphingosinithalassobacter tenebrarum]
MAEAEREDISRRANWRALAFAFLVWAAHFIVVYAVALVAPDHPVDGWIASFACLAALGTLFLFHRRIGPQESTLARSARAIAGFAIVLQTLPPLLL